MKKLRNILKLNFLPLVMCIGIGIALEPTGRDIMVSDILIGVVIGYYSSLILFKLED